MLFYVSRTFKVDGFERENETPLDELRMHEMGFHEKL